MLNKFYLLIFILITSYAWGDKAYALGEKGHYLVCQLAYQQLSAAQQTDVKQLMSYFPESERKRLKKHLRLPKKHQLTFADACSWPDSIKQLKQYKQFNQWHFINVGRDRTIIDSSFVKSNCKLNCIIDAISYHQKQLQSQQKGWLKLQALLFLGHWLGDIHQPLHVSFKSDLGGNKSLIKDASKYCSNLHRVWDSCLINHLNRKTYVIDQTFKIDSKDHYSQDNINYWATQSLKISRLPKTMYCQIIDSHCQPHKQPIILPKNYQLEQQEVLLTQINLAAKRLFLMINSDL
ncbi:S1/P1 nuclease [Thalassotalea crassostreae]|uniref:S1/P1 nuclease n=1 Tax=Thalassotalea crassostreae TaxID=1763536 RepID=UPI0008386A63|nr:S1/P1 nuclease [Thalassotalea crassostreae]